MSHRLSAAFKVYRLDLRNHGASPHSEIMDYGAMAGDVADSLDEQHLSSAFLLGHSLGGKVAVQFAFDFPERARKLVVVDIAPRSYEPSHRALLDAALGLDLSAFGSFADADAALARPISEPAVRQLLVKNLRRNRHGNLTWKVNLAALAANYEKLTAPPTAQGPFYGPTCFIRGGRSGYVTDDDVPVIRRMFPQAIIETLPDAGHWVHVDAGEAFTRIVTEFLNRKQP